MSSRQALAAYQRGDFVTTEAICAQVLERQPNDAATWELRGLAAWRAGNVEFARQCLTSVVRINPNGSSHHFNLGRLLVSRGQYTEAISCFQTVLAHSPNDIEAIALLGNVYLHLGENHQARQVYESALDKNPESAILLNNLGLAKVKQRHLADALELFQRALALAPGTLEILRNLAMYTEMSGDPERAQRILDAASEKWPNDPSLNLVKVKLLLRDKNATAAVDIAKQFLNGELEPRLAGDFSFDLAHGLEMLGEYGPAFQQFALANQLTVQRLKNSGFTRNSRIVNELITRLCHYYHDHPVGSAAMDIADDYPDPVFIVGMPRSGTTVLDSVVGSGLGARVLEEEATVSTILDAFVETGFKYPDDCDKLNEAMANRLREAYFNATRSVLGGDITTPLVDKMPFNLPHVAFLARIFPGARFLRALRHPADVLMSNLKQNYDEPHSALLFSDLNAILDIEEQFENLWNLQLPWLEGRAITVKYENLVGDTENTTRAIFDFLGVRHAKLNETERQAHVRGKLARVSPNYAAVAEPLNAGRSGQWRAYLPHLEPQLERLGKLATRQGYKMGPK